MNTYVIIFRQGRPVSDAEKKRRSEETGVWARQHNAAGHKLDPRILASEAERRDAQFAGLEPAPAAGWPVTALLFLEARDLDEAVAVAESHPARRYGANIEVRPWAAPIPASASTTAALAR